MVAISEKAKRPTGRGFLIVFFLFFIVIGGLILVLAFLRPAMKVLAARNWLAVPCKILASAVDRHDSDDGATYSVEILYEYQVNGRAYRSNRYSFMGGSSSGYEGKRRIVRRYPPGHEVACYVDPDDPFEAVLMRGFTPGMLFGLIPLVFVLVGATGLRYQLRERPRKAEAPALPEWMPKRPGDVSALGQKSRTLADGAVELQVGRSRLYKFVGMLLLAAFWNGLVSIFATMAVKSWLAGRPEYCLSIFIVPFVLIGIAILGGAVYCLMGLFNPKPRLRLNGVAVPLGEPLEIAWVVEGAVHRIERLRIALEGREEATYTRGTDTVTDKETFARLEIADVRDRAAIRAGKASVVLPADTMHSFAAEHNKIIWTLKVEGAVARWPDIKDEFAFTILPRMPEGEAMHEYAGDRNA